MAKKGTIKRFTKGNASLTVFTPSLLSNKQVLGKFLATLQAIEKKAHAELNKTVQTWNDPPTFLTTEKGFKGGDLRLEVEPVGTELQVKKWKWLDKGTTKRYATMKRTFIRKTQPRSFIARAGTTPSGKGVAYVRIEVLRPGIVARQWSSMLSRNLALYASKLIYKTVKEVFE
jgi:hypothetical protein